MKQRPGDLWPEAVAILLLVGAIIAAGCSRLSGLALRVSASPTPLALARCDETAGILCVVTFGIEPPNRMLIEVLAPLGGFEDIRLDVAYKGSRAAYPCHASTDFPRNFMCIGPQIPLGNTIRIDVTTGDSRTPLAGGDFLLTSFALPTVSGGVLPAPGTAYPNPSPDSP